MKKICSFVLCLFFLIGISNVCSMNSYGLEENASYEEKLAESELLYSKINQFLESHQDVSPEDFKLDRWYYVFADKNNTEPVALNKEDFTEQSCGKVVLYFGKNFFADNNMESGLWFTSVEELAFNLGEGPAGKMFLSAREGKSIKEIKYSYLQELVNIMCSNHSEEFDKIKEKIENWKSICFAIIEYVSEVKKVCTTQDEIDRAFENPDYQSAYQQATREEQELFKDNKAALFCDFGVLAKMLGYNVLQRDKGVWFGFDAKEYLVLDTGILTICK